MNKFDGKFKPTQIRNPKESFIRYAAIRAELFEMFTTKKSLTTRKKLCEAFSRRHPLCAASTVNNWISNKGWGEELKQAKLDAFPPNPPPEIPITWHNRPWNMQASCYS